MIATISVTFLIGLAMVVVAVLGGGIEIREIKIPTLPFFPRLMTFITGCILIVVCVGFPQFIPQVQHSEKHLGASIDSGLISVRQVKAILDHLGMKVGPIDNNWTREYARAVGDFQFSQHIEADGMVGPETYAKLRAAWPEYFSGGAKKLSPDVPANP